MKRSELGKQGYDFVSRDCQIQKLLAFQKFDPGLQPGFVVALRRLAGAYQYVDSTWAGYGGYPSAYLAPPAMQDQRAAADVNQILATYHDVAYVPVVWYYPPAASNPARPSSAKSKFARSSSRCLTSSSYVNSVSQRARAISAR